MKLKKQIEFEIIICTFVLEQKLRFHATNFPIYTQL